MNIQKNRSQKEVDKQRIDEGQNWSDDIDEKGLPIIDENGYKKQGAIQSLQELLTDGQISQMSYNKALQQIQEGLSQIIIADNGKTKTILDIY